MNPQISDRRAMLAGVVALGAVILAFLGAFLWLQFRVMQVHDRETFEALYRELELRREVDRFAGREALEIGLAARMELLPAAPYFALVDRRGAAVVGRLADIPGGREALRMAATRPQLRLPQDDGIVNFTVALPLDDGATVILSRRDPAPREILRSLGIAGLVGTLVVVAMGLLAGFAFNRFILEHVSSLAVTARRILRGQSAARAPERQRLDALGALTGTFNEMLDQNEALVSGLRTVTESLAHDLRSPLIRVRRSISAARDSTDPQEREAQLAQAESEASRALLTFNALVDLGRAEAGLSRDSMEEVDIGALATDLAELFEPIADEHGQRLECEVVACRVVAHRQILSQAISNLLENAIKYSPSGTRLRLQVRRYGDNGAEVSVEDEGPGIPEHAREQALRPFVRLGDPVSRPGVGLGLAIAAAVARLHRGRLLLESADPGLRVRLQIKSG
jgi:signal transduction histidine kinase